MTAPNSQLFPDNVAPTFASLGKPGSDTLKIFEFREGVLRALAAYNAFPAKRQAMAPAQPEKWDIWIAPGRLNGTEFESADIKIYDGAAWVDLTPYTFARALYERAGGVVLPDNQAGFLKNNGNGVLTWDAAPVGGGAPGTFASARKRLAAVSTSACVALSNPIKAGFYVGEATDAAPDIAQGTQVLTATVTPSANTSKVGLRFQGFAHVFSGYTIVAIFRGNTCIKCVPLSGVTNSNWLMPIAVDVEDSPATTAPVTYSVRVGPHISGYATALNGFVPGSGAPFTSGGTGPQTHLFGTAGRSDLIVDEILDII